MKDNGINEIFNLENLENFEDYDFAKTYYLQISCVIPKNINKLKKYLSFTSKIIKPEKVLDENDILFVTNELIHISEIGNIFYGYTKYGRINIGDTLNIFCEGKILNKTIKSIQKKLVDSKNIESGESGCIQLAKTNKNDKLDKNSVIISDSMKRFIKNIVVFTPYESLPPKKSYLMFNGSSLQQVDLFYSDENKIYYKASNGSDLFILPDSITILKDETHLTFIGTSKIE